MEIMGIYGPVEHGRSHGFLAEISDKIASCKLPRLMGGDLNLIRSVADKNNDNLNLPLIDLFNDSIASWDLREIPRTGARYT
jgi:hypothetical protein